MKEPTVLTVSQVVAKWDEFNTILDARSPAEYAQDHLPGARSAPVLSDDERVRVGICHAHEGAFEAKRMGAALVARNIGNLIGRDFAAMDRQWSPLVYCWRGGNRSGALATVLARVGWRTSILEGGYKAFRRQVIDDLDSWAKGLTFLVVGGRTGSAKSRLLQKLAEKGQQVLDLEALAAHRGSVLGSMPDTRQPSQKAFETLLWDKMRAFDPSRPVFVESESRKVGRVQLPEGLIERIRASRVALIEADIDVRSHFLLHEYAHFQSDPASLLPLLDCLVPLHGAQRIDAWKALIANGRWETLVNELLREHYDPSYDRSMKRNFEQLCGAGKVTLRNTGDETLDQASATLIAWGTQRADR